MPPYGFIAAVGYVETRGQHVDEEETLCLVNPRDTNVWRRGVPA